MWNLLREPLVKTTPPNSSPRNCARLSLRTIPTLDSHERACVVVLQVVYFLRTADAPRSKWVHKGELQPLVPAAGGQQGYGGHAYGAGQRVRVSHCLLPFIVLPPSGAPPFALIFTPFLLCLLCSVNCPSRTLSDFHRGRAAASKAVREAGAGAVLVISVRGRPVGRYTVVAAEEQHVFAQFGGGAVSSTETRDASCTVAAG